MQFNVASLLKETTGAIREYDIDDDVVIDGKPHHFTGHVRMDRTPNGILVRTRMRAEDVGGECSRCLRQVMYPIDIAFEEEYVPVVDVTTGQRVGVDDVYEDAYRINEHHEVDLTEPVRQYWAMALPMAPLCSDDCRGLCALCGQRVEDDDHPCGRDQIDSRWEKLERLKL